MASFGALHNVQLQKEVMQKQPRCQKVCGQGKERCGHTTHFHVS